MNTLPAGPPINLILEIPSAHGDTCPVGCRHCIHTNAELSGRPPLMDEEILSLITQGRQLGATFVNIYPHQGDISLEDPRRMERFFGYARRLGMQTKTVSSGISARGLEPLLPHLDRLAVSVDSLDPQTYTELRTSQNYTALMETLEMLRGWRKAHPTPLLNALVMVNKRTLENIEIRVAQIVALGLFDRVKLLEMIPLGRAASLRSLALTEKSDLDRLRDLRSHYEVRGVRVGVPLWRVEEGHRGCRLGHKDFVVGPRGELAGCTLMFYLNQVVGNAHDTSLEAAWQAGLEKYRQKEQRPVSGVCLTCSLYTHDLCWGGCAARNLVHGDAERLRGCGVVNEQDARSLYEALMQTGARQPEGGKFFSPLCDDLHD